MTATAVVHSRSILAGYVPERLRMGKVLVVGLGALGQNLVQNLALVGIGQLMLVDFDDFETHNATRSPFYPTWAEAAQFGLGKAPVVAHRAAQITTASDAAVFYSDDLIQVLGDGAVSWADIVVAAVDSLTGRAWLAERCRLLSKPLVEGGFSGSDFNLSAFATDDGAPCYRCGRPGRESSMSCTAYALAAEKVHIVPAIQTVAAVIGGYLAELVVQLLHDQPDRLGYRSYGNVRRETLETALLSADSTCPGIHHSQPVIGTLHDTGQGMTVQDLMAAITGQFGAGRITLSEPAIPATSCTLCRTPCLVQATESAWLANPRCSNCGGPWPVTEVFTPNSVSEISTGDVLSEELASTPLRNLGLRYGASLIATLSDGRSGLIRIDGDVLDCLERATTLDRAALDL